MNYKALTIFNYKISYYLFRVFTLFWLVEQLYFYKKFAQRPTEFYEPSVWIQKLVIPVFPSEIVYYSALLLAAFLLLFSLYRFSVVLNIILFLLVAYISLPVVAYRGLSHTNHLLILSYFFSLFLNPKTMQESDYKSVEIYYLGLLVTYSLAGFWKLASATKDLITQNPDISWFEKDAAKYNTIYNYFIIDQSPPQWIMNFYEYETFWVVLTIVGILLQTLCFLGAFSRKYLTFTLLFLLIFHLYTVYFVVADLRIMKYGLIVLFFPYHTLYEAFLKLRKFRVSPS